MTIREKVAKAVYPANFSLAQVAITAFLEAAAEEGWHMRPDKATEEMVGVVVDSCRAENIEIFREDEDALPDVVWNAMLVAAPKFEWDQ